MVCDAAPIYSNLSSKAAVRGAVVEMTLLLDGNDGNVRDILRDAA